MATDPKPLAGKATADHHDQIMLHRVQTIDSHTAGEPTRTVIAGGPKLATVSMQERRKRLIDDFDDFRAAVIAEPRGSDLLVGAWLCESSIDRPVAGVVFFNNVGALHMCGHGTIGVAVTLAYLGRIDAGRHCLETSVGDVWFDLEADLHTVRLQNVPSYRAAKDVALTLDNGETVVGDVAWGGNWFFLTQHDACAIDTEHVDRLKARCQQIKAAIAQAGITGDDGVEIDHIELYSASSSADAKNFVLCPGNAWDRSPCGTGTSAKVACLAADGHLEPNRVWRQESVTGSIFEASYERGEANKVMPTIRGSAWITGENDLVFDSNDPLGIDPIGWR